MKRPDGGQSAQRKHVLNHKGFWDLVDILASDIPVHATMTDHHYQIPIDMDGALVMKDLRNMRFEVEAERVNPEIPAWLTTTFSRDRNPTASISARTYDGIYTIASGDLHYDGGTVFMPEASIEMEGNHLRFPGKVTRDGWYMKPETVQIQSSTSETEPYVAFAVSGIYDFMFDKLDTPYGDMKLYNENRGDNSLCWIIISPNINLIDECQAYIDRFFKMCAFGWKRHVQAVHKVVCDGHNVKAVSQPLWSGLSNNGYGMCELYGRDKVLHPLAKAATNPQLSQILQRASLWYTAGSTFVNSIAMEAFVCLEYLTYALHDLYIWCKPFEQRMRRMSNALEIVTSDLSTNSDPFKAIIDARNNLVHQGNPDHLNNEEFVALIRDAHRIIERLVLAVANRHSSTNFTQRIHPVAQ